MVEALRGKRARGRLFRKYVALFVAVVALALVPVGALDIWFSYQGIKSLLIQVQREQASSAAAKIGQFIREIENQMAWETQLPLQARSDDEWYFDNIRLLRQVPALTEVAQLDGQGRERFRISRQSPDVIRSMRDLSGEPAFVGAMDKKVYYGPVYFVHQSEPYMTIAIAGAERDHGVVIGQVNLKFIWDVVSQIKVGTSGQAYVADANGRLIAHPDISLVLRNTDLAGLDYVQQARRLSETGSQDGTVAVTDFKGQSVLSAFAPVEGLRWLVFADLPIDEAYEPLYQMLQRSSLLLLSALLMAVVAGLFLSRKMVGPIRSLTDGAARIGSGNLQQRISIQTGDELEVLGGQFNAMAERLQESYANLERKVEERTRDLEDANLAKSRFLAAASHDLRQPLHALGLFIAQLQGRTRADERKRLLSRIDAALAAMNELFNALLDVSKLDAGVMNPALTDFPVAQVLRRVEATFTGAAREKGLSLRIVGCRGWVRSDHILLERIVSNLVSNAIRYTASGRVLVGCRRRGGSLLIQVWDTGAGIRKDQHRHIFVEFYRVNKGDGETRGLGLGLAIVDRLCRLLHHPIAVISEVGKGSCFTVTVPRAESRAEHANLAPVARKSSTLIPNRPVLVIDNDQMVLDGMGGLLRSWGYQVFAAVDDESALHALAEATEAPDFIISDYHLRPGLTGIDAIARINAHFGVQVPALIMSGDTDPETLRHAHENGYRLLHKPVEPMMLRALLLQLSKKRQLPVGVDA